jgi:hypothetical protein
MQIHHDPVRSSWRVALADAPKLEVKSWNGLRLQYRVVAVLVVHLENGTDYFVMYGVRIRKSDGVSFGCEIPVSGNYREVVTL